MFVKEEGAIGYQERCKKGGHLVLGRVKRWVIKYEIGSDLNLKSIKPGHWLNRIFKMCGICGQV